VSLTPQLHMVKPNLGGLPVVRLPEGYALRTFREGDEVHWTRILAASFQGPPEKYSFDAILRNDAAFLPERIFFVTCGVQPVATASAYYRPEFMPNAGMVHYVAALPEHTGKRLGYWVTLATLHRMAAEGRQRAWLSTDDFRLPAIKTYLNLGFEPLLIDENQRARWRKVFADLGLPELCDRFAPILEGPLWVKGS